MPFFHFPVEKQAENMVVRSNGQLLVTVDTAPELYQINPLRKQVGRVVHRFEGYTSLFGIVEGQADVFFVITSNFSGPPNYYGYEGSVGIFEVDLRRFGNHSNTTQGTAKVSKILDVPQAQLLDGLVMINQSDGLLMSGDAQTGILYLINVRQRTATAVLHDPLFEGTMNEVTAGLAHVGINGMKYHDGELYFTNTAKELYGKIPIDRATGQPTGKPCLLANYGTYVDDLSFDAFGNQFISQDIRGVLLRPANTTAAKNGTMLLSVLPGADSNAFGRTALDRCTLYSTFAGPNPGVASIDVGREGFCR